MKTNHSYKIQHSHLIRGVFIMLGINFLKFTNFSEEKVISNNHQYHHLASTSTSRHIGDGTKPMAY